MTGTEVHIPTLTTERLILRAPKPADLDAYADFGASDRAAGVGGCFNRDQAFLKLSALIGHWHLRGFGRWILADPESDAALGIVGLYHPESWPEREIAWSVFADAEGKGLAHEAARAARAYAYDVLGWTTVISCTAPGNIRSEALARRLGAWFDGVFPHPDHGDLTIWRHPGPEALA